MKKFSLIFVFILYAVITKAQDQTASKVNANRVPVKFSDLPREITTVNMGTEHLGFAIKEAYKTTQEGAKNYEVHITNGSINEILLYDLKGKFIKKTESKPVVLPKKETAKSTETTQKVPTTKK